MKMKKSDIETHSDRFRPAHPAVNVKCRNFIGTAKIQERFRCCEKTAEKALGFVWGSGVEQFWEMAVEIASEALGSHVKVYSEGRSGGWLVVHGLSEIESWDAIAVARWASFVKKIESQRDWFTSDEFAFDMIEANDWAQADPLLDDEDMETAEREEWEARDVMTV
jgi:hypothetical protein